MASPEDIGERVSSLGTSFVHLRAGAGTEGQTGGTPRRPQGWAGRLAALLQRIRTAGTAARERDAKVDALDPLGVAAQIRSLAPDLVMIDIELPVHIMAAWSTGVRVALWTTMLSVWKRPGVPPLGSSTTPGAGIAGSRLGIEWSWLVFRAWKWLRMARLRFTRMGTDQLSVLSEVAARTGFPLRSETRRYEWLIPFVYQSLPVLSFNAFELEFPHEPLPVCTYVGPVLNPQRRSAADDSALSQRLEQIYARRRNETSRKLVYCSFGAWHKGDDRDFVTRVVAAVASHPEWDLIVGLGGRLDPAALGPVAENVHVLSWAPQMEVLANCDAAIHHGGISSVNECITAGVPMVVYPFEFLDQPGNAARVAYHGLGEVGDRTADTPELIGLRLDRIMSSDEVRSQVSRMRDDVRRYDRDDRAVVAIRTLLATAD